MKARRQRTSAGPRSSRIRSRLCDRVRAIWDEDKSNRQQDLVDGAARLFAKREFAEIGILDICREAGLAKGTFYLYFESKEEVFLKLAEHQLTAWSAASLEALATLPVPTSISKLAETYAASFNSFDELLRLMSMLHDIIERKVKAARIVPFKQNVAQLQVAQLSAWQRHLPLLMPDELMALMEFVTASVVGVWTLLHPPASAREAMVHAGLAAPTAGFSEVFGRQLTYFLRGLTAKG